MQQVNNIKLPAEFYFKNYGGSTIDEFYLENITPVPNNKKGYSIANGEMLIYRGTGIGRFDFSGELFIDGYTNNQIVGKLKARVVRGRVKTIEAYDKDNHLVYAIGPWR